jgi:hypothetical protein
MAFTKEQREAKKLAQLVENQGEKSEVVGESGGAEQETTETKDVETEQPPEQGTEQETAEEKPEYVTIKLNKVTALKLLGCVPNSLYVQGKNVMFDNLQATVHVDVQAYLAEQGLIEVD